MTMTSQRVSIDAIDRISHAFGVCDNNNGPSAFVVRFVESGTGFAPDPMVVAADSEEAAGQEALKAMAAGYPFFSADSDPLMHWAFARSTLRTLFLLETARTGGAATGQPQLRRLRRAQAIDQRLQALDQAFECPQLTKKSRSKVLHGEISELEYEPALAPIERIDFAYTACSRRAALLVNGAPYQPIEVVGLALEFSALLREAQLYEARLLGARRPIARATSQPAQAKTRSSDVAPEIPTASLAAQNDPVSATVPSDELLFVSTTEASRRLGVSVNYLAKLRLTGGGPRFSKFGRTVRYSVKNLLEWAHARTQTSTSDVHNVC